MMYPVGTFPVFTLKRTDTTLDLSQRPRKYNKTICKHSFLEFSNKLHYGFGDFSPTIIFIFITIEEVISHIKLVNSTHPQFNIIKSLFLFSFYTNYPHHLTVNTIYTNTSSIPPFPPFEYSNVFLSSQISCINHIVTFPPLFTNSQKSHILYS